MKHSPRQSAYLVPLLAVLVSCLFSVYSIATNPLLNNDAFGYLRAAELFNSKGVAAVLSDYGWYGYSILIALADRVLPGDLLISAQVLNTASHALLTYVFMRLCTEFVARDARDLRRIELFAALTILGFPLLNEMRYFLIRDFAFWAFILLGLLQLVRYNRNPRWPTALYFCLSMLAATLFRVEALILTALAPLALLATTGPQRSVLRKPGLLLGMLLALVAVVFVAALASGIDLIEQIRFAWRYYLPLLADLGGVLTSTALALNQAVFTETNFPMWDNLPLGLVVLIFAYMFALLINLAGALSVPVSVLLIIAFWRGDIRVPYALRGPLAVYAGTAVLMLLVFIFIMHFLTHRYATLLCLLLLTLVPGILNTWYERARLYHSTHRFQAIVGLFCGYFFIDSLISFGHSRDYLVQAIVWSANDLPAGASLHTNHMGIAYGSGRVVEYDKIALEAEAALEAATGNDYLLLDIRRDDRELKALLDANPQFQLVRSFANERGDEVRVYLARY